MNTRDQVIAHHINMALRHTPISRESFADDVVSNYHARTALAHRGITFHVVDRGADPYAVQRANAQLLFRMLTGVVRMPAEIEEALVLSLPEPYRSACLHDLANRYGLLATPMPAATPEGQVVQVGDLASEFGQTLQAIAKTLGDGHLTPSDAGNARVAVRELKELMAMAHTLCAQHQAIVDGSPKQAGMPEERY